MNEDELVNICSSVDDRFSLQKKFNQTQNINNNNLTFNPNSVLKGSFLNDISIEGVDEDGRVSLRSLSGKDSSSGLLKWKRKSELSKEIPADKSRISIKGQNNYEFKLK